MAGQRNFLLGYGERLTEPIRPIVGGSTSEPPYTFEQARIRLRPMLEETSTKLDELPDQACPHDFAVAALTLHPQYIAKSYYPHQLLREANLTPVGSRPTLVRPERLRKGRRTTVQETPRPTTDLLVAGRRVDFRRWATSLPKWDEHQPGAKELFELERIRFFAPEERIASLSKKTGLAVMEIGLHLPEGFGFVLKEFEDYANTLGFNADINRGLLAGGLYFLPMLISREVIPRLAQFSFLRVAREMPRLRTLPTVTRASTLRRKCELPSGGELDPSLTIAVFDGGAGSAARLSDWVENLEAPGVGPAVPEYEEHGAAVTSALLFGSLEDQGITPLPFCRVAHYRVLDTASHNDPYELYDVLKRVVRILEANRYEFINLSIGPDLPIEDHEVHAWTAVLDRLFHRKGILATVAVGNSGEQDAASGNARVQVPADCVNGLSVGGSTSISGPCQRAPYSAIGPGRSPGLVKPDVLAFGGCGMAPFWVIDPAVPGSALPTMGTSFASPTALRMATGIRAHLGPVLSPLAIKTLLIHTAVNDGNPRHEVGWGRIANALDDMVVCPDGVTRVVYQGELEPGQFVRAQIPIPEDEMPGLVNITATFCFTSDTDPEDPSNYTRSGLRVIFRPHDDLREKDGAHPKSRPFFNRKEYESEIELRRDAQKWETTLHHREGMRGSSLKDPVFDIHCNARAHGGRTGGESIRYALMVTVSSKRSPDLYDRILQRYRTLLRPLRPQIEIPILTRE